jgi:hypothetical protein
MRAISLVLCGLIVLVTVGACSKSGGARNVVGNWRLVGYTDYSGFVYVSTDIHSLLINADHTYTMRTGDSVTSSGAYHVEAPRDAERHTVF